MDIDQKTHQKPLAMWIGCTIRNVFRLIRARAQDNTEAKLTMEQFGLLHAISQKKEEVIQKDMADFMGKDKSAILRMIDTLEEKELVRRVVDTKDRRKNQILITQKGSKSIEEHLLIEYQMDKELLEGLDAADTEVFFKVLNHIQTKAELLLDNN